ncbi:MAG: NAD(P)H-binding protein [Actinomycetota bacterium]|nr:NAD(P)H-binding protein [Actinomycetota bacterium]
MARVLIIGCGCRGQALTRRLRAAGHSVRGTTRDPARCDVITAAGAEPHLGDPDRIATIAPAFAHVGVVVILLGSAQGGADLEPLFGTRLDMLLERMLDTTARAVVYESAGPAGAALLASGAERVRYWCERSLIPYGLIETDPADYERWLDDAEAVVISTLGA